MKTDLNTLDKDSDELKKLCNIFLTSIQNDITVFKLMDLQFQGQAIQQWFKTNDVQNKVKKVAKNTTQMLDTLIYPRNWGVSYSYNAYGLTRLTTNRAIRQLKLDKKIIQIGTGHGTGLCLVDPSLYVLGPVIPDGYIDPSNVDELLKAVTEQLEKAQSAKLEEQLEQVKAENERLLKELADSRSQSWY